MTPNEDQRSTHRALVDQIMNLTHQELRDVIDLLTRRLGGDDGEGVGVPVESGPPPGGLSAAREMEVASDE